MTADRSEWFERKALGRQPLWRLIYSLPEIFLILKVFRAERWKQSKQKEIICHKKFPIFTLSC